MTTAFVPNVRLLNLQVSGTPGLSGTTLPRSILQQQGWPDALIEDYDAKGANSGENGSTLQFLGEQTHQSQVWNRENQVSIESLRNQVAQGELRIVAAERQVAALTIRVTELNDQVTTLSNNVTALTERVVTAEQSITELSPQTGTALPENTITSNRSQTYYQISGTTTEIFFNPTVGVNTGWVQMT